MCAVRRLLPPGLARIFHQTARAGEICGLTVLLLCQGCVNSVTSTALPAASDGDAAVANLYLGAAYFREGRLQLALERLDRALEHDPRLAEAHSTIAMVYDRLGEAEEARHHYRRATRLEPDNPAAANSYGVYLCRRAQWDDAERQFMRAARNPRYPTPEAAYTNAGICARNAGDGIKAERFFRQALGRNPAYADGLYNMAALAFGNGDAASARIFLRRHLDSAPDNPQVILLCFQVETHLGNIADAQHCASILRAQFPETAEMAQLDQFEHGGER